MYEMLVKPKEKYGITHKDMPVQKQSYSKYEPLGYTQCVPAESRLDYYLLQEPKSMGVVSEKRSGDDGVIQMWRLMDTSYGQTNNFRWANGTQTPFCQKMDSAIKLALNRLNYFTDAVSQGDADTFAQYIMLY